VKFNIDLDKLYERVDNDKNGVLDRFEAFVYMEELSKYIDDSMRASTFSREKFNDAFKRLDRDRENYIEKSEVSILIKLLFKYTP